MVARGGRGGRRGRYATVEMFEGQQEQIQNLTRMVMRANNGQNRRNDSDHESEHARDVENELNHRSGEETDSSIDERSDRGRQRPVQHNGGLNRWEDRIVCALQASKEYGVQVNIKEFDGDMEPEAFLDWMDSIESYFDWKEVPTERKLALKGETQLARSSSRRVGNDRSSGLQNQQNSQGQMNIKCYCCFEPGHKSNECPKGTNARVNLAEDGEVEENFEGFDDGNQHLKVNDLDGVEEEGIDGDLESCKVVANLPENRESALLSRKLVGNSPQSRRKLAPISSETRSQQSIADGGYGCLAGAPIGHGWCDGGGKQSRHGRRRAEIEGRERERRVLF
ncbi:hypothetical protein Acr_23g0015720 [Actinidia rufa]|uniref:CCHC-type domain-containing protein n=1 Tax=Actinidia rufa TaxID=165716 RepID=A0A7J0GQV0_9ERIC|nr:hypothetical protein Acr_23g0015720 [Actinidia rufa]